MKTFAKAVGVAWVMVGIAGSDLEAQEDGWRVGADCTEAEVWRNMYEGGLISEGEYQHALQYGALPVPHQG
jgi:hypothetical protein